jgi:hypothetical protein
VFKKAYDLLPTDKTVLNRYGRYLWIKALRTKRDKKMQRKILKEAEIILTASLENDPRENRFAYSNRMLVRKDLANSSQDKIKQKMYMNPLCIFSYLQYWPLDLLSKIFQLFEL